MATLLDGENFSGRAKWLAARRHQRTWPDVTVLGALADSASTGLAWRLGEELELAASIRTPSCSPPGNISEMLGLLGLLDQEIHTLSGGEAVRAALASIANQGVNELQIVSALEQLDQEWRARVISLIVDGESQIAKSVLLLDNHVSDVERQKFSTVQTFSPAHPELNGPCKLDPRGAMNFFTASANEKKILISNLSFEYRRSHRIFDRVSLALQPGTLYFLVGANGSGKTTFVRLLSGTLLPKKGTLKFGFRTFRAARIRCRNLAVAFQNPDYQWTKNSVNDEVVSVLPAGLDGVNEGFLDTFLETFGIPKHSGGEIPLELPFTLKKRLGNALAIVAGKAWVALDEPTLGQGAAYRTALALLIKSVLETGIGVIITSHDSYFRSLFPSAKILKFDQQNVRSESD